MLLEFLTGMLQINFISVYIYIVEVCVDPRYPWSSAGGNLGPYEDTHMNYWPNRSKGWLDLNFLASEKTVGILGVRWSKILTEDRETPSGRPRLTWFDLQASFRRAMADSFASLLVNLQMIGFGKFLALRSGSRCAIYTHTFIPPPQGAFQWNMWQTIKYNRTNSMWI